MNWLNQDTALLRGVRTAVQAAIGLVVTVYGVSGVPESIHHYVNANLVPVIVAFGVPAGVAGFVWNYLRSDVKNV